MLLNEFQVNDQQLNGDLGYAEGLLISIEKNISLRESQAETTLISIEKIIARSIASTTLISISKIINDANAPTNTFFSRNGWEPFITVGGLLLTSSELTGGINVVKGEGDNTTASFTIILAPDVYDLYSFQGKDVKITIHTNTGLYTIFNGKVDVPVIDVIEEKLTLNCVADRRILLNALQAVEPYIGYYSEAVLGTDADVSDRITARMSTIPASLDFDSWNRYSVTSWTAKASPDFTYGSSAVYRRDPKLTFDSSGQIVNKVTLNLDFNFQRHHSRYARFTWTHPYAPSRQGICDFLEVRPTMPTKAVIVSAIEGAGWPIRPDSVTFEAQFRAGSYMCNGVWSQWATAQTTYSNQPKTNPDGTPKTDASGNTIMESKIDSITDYYDLYAMGAEWTATKQFSQNIKEQYSVTVQSPESITRYGVIPTEESYSYTGEDAYPEWEQDDVFREAPAGVTTYSDATSGSYFFNSDEERSAFNQAFLCAVNKAKTTILATHRNSRITFQRAFTPTIELKHTVALTGKWIRGKGKCSRISHYLNVSDSSFGVGGDFYTEIEFRQYRGNTTVSETPILPPTQPSDTVVPTQAGAILQTHLGEDPSQPQAVNWNGYVGNKLVTRVVNGKTNYSRTNYEESFIVDTPDIPPAIRDERVLTSSGSYNINIPNDDIEYEAYG